MSEKGKKVLRNLGYSESQIQQAYSWAKSHMGRVLTVAELKQRGLDTETELVVSFGNVQDRPKWAKPPAGNRKS